MSQHEVMQFLKSKKDNDNWYTAAEIRGVIGGYVSENCRRLRQAGMVRFKRMKGEGKRYNVILYKWGGI